MDNKDELGYPCHSQSGLKQGFYTVIWAPGNVYTGLETGEQGTGVGEGDDDEVQMRLEPR